MTRRGPRCAIASVVLASIAAASSAEPARSGPAPSDVAGLERDLRAHPGDVDLRFRLAAALARTDRRSEARREAEAVLAQAPDYHDAALLLARLDAWDRRWQGARARLDRVLAARPRDVDARLLAVDIELWSGHVAAARRLLSQLRPIEVGELEHWHRDARIAVAELDHRRARMLTQRILAIDPDRPGVRELQRTASAVSVESATDVELYPATYPARFAIGETLSATAFPRARWSATVVYEYWRRFATDNHRIAVRGDWRATDRWSLLGFARTGLVEVVPKVTAFGEARWTGGRALAAARYTYDRMPWPGDLHRVQVTVGARLVERLAGEADGMIGMLRGCDTATTVWSARGRLAWTRGRWELAGAYGYGLEAERAIAFGSDACATAMDLIDRAIHAGGLDVTRTLWSGVTLRLSFGLQRRDTGAIVELGGLAVRSWF